MTVFDPACTAATERLQRLKDTAHAGEIDAVSLRCDRSHVIVIGASTASVNKRVGSNHHRSTVSSPPLPLIMIVASRRRTIDVVSAAAKNRIVEVRAYDTVDTE